jgi:hypothetical protein
MGLIPNPTKPPTSQRLHERDQRLAILARELPERLP